MAAGQGFKTFATGDVLTAADTNGYLMSQTVMVFADSTARTAAITSPQQGMVSFLKGTNSTEYYNGSAWVSIAGASSPLTTKGDIWGYSTTNARVPVGSNGQVLTADSTNANGVVWATASGAKDKWVQIATASITSGTSYSFTGISGYSQLMIIWRNLSQSAAGGQYITLTLNNDSGTNYDWYGYANNVASATTGVAARDSQVAGSQFYLAYNSAQADTNSGAIILSGCDDTGLKVGTQISGTTATATNFSYQAGLVYKGSSAITSVQFATTGTAFDGAGTATIFGSVA